MRRAILFLLASAAYAQIPSPSVSKENPSARAEVRPEVLSLRARTIGANISDYGAKCDGNTDDSGAVMAAQAALPNGGTIFFPLGVCRFSRSIRIAKPTSLRGQGIGNADHPTTLLFDQGVTGIVIRGGHRSHISDLLVKSAKKHTGDDDGILVLDGGAVLIEDVAIMNFGRNGLRIDSTAGGNNNHGTYRRLRVSLSGRDGIYVTGRDSQQLTFLSVWSESSGGYGFFAGGGGAASRTYIAPMTQANKAGGYYDESGTSMYINPYSEAEPGSQIGRTGQYQLWLMGDYARVPLTNNGGATNTIFCRGVWAGMNWSPDTEKQRLLLSAFRPGSSHALELRDGLPYLWTVDKNGTMTAQPGGTVPVKVKVPSSSSDACTVNSFAVDEAFLYWCIGPSHWIRFPKDARW